MNNKWKYEILQMKSLKGWVISPSVLWQKKKELKLTNDQIVFILEILSHDEDWIFYDEASTVASRCSLYRYRKELKKLGYLEWPVTYTKVVNGECTQSGFKYNLDGLLNAIKKLYQDDTSQYQDDTSQSISDTDQYLDETLLSNLPKQSSLNNSSKQSTTIFAESKAELTAPVGRQTTSNNTIELTEEQQELVDLWNDLYPNIKARKGDLKNLSEVDLDDINWYKPIEWWKYFCKDTDDKLISTSDRSLTLFLKNINKVVSWKDQLHYQLQKRLDFNLEKALENKYHEDLDIDIRTENNIPKYYWYDKVTGNIICDATENYIENMLKSSADNLKTYIRRNMNYNKEQLEMTERLTCRNINMEIEKEEEAKRETQDKVDKELIDALKKLNGEIE